MKTIQTKDGNLLLINNNNYHFAYATANGELVRETNYAEWSWAETCWNVPVVEVAPFEWVESELPLKVASIPTSMGVNNPVMTRTFSLNEASPELTKASLIRYAKSLSYSISDALKSGTDAEADWISDPTNQFANFCGYADKNNLVYETLSGIAVYISIDCFTATIQIKTVSKSLNEILSSEGFKPRSLALDGARGNTPLITALVRIYLPDFEKTFKFEGKYVVADYTQRGNHAIMQIWKNNEGDELMALAHREYIDRGSQPSKLILWHTAFPMPVASVVSGNLHKANINGVFLKDLI